MNEVELIDIPQNAKDFAVKFAKLCKEYKLGSGSGTCDFRTNWEGWNNWYGELHITWVEGRHGEERNDVSIETIMKRKVYLLNEAKI
jgi:hypothetical protein